MTDRGDILAYVRGLLEQLAKDWDYAGPIEPGTLLFSQLGFESLDAVVLGTAIQDHFKRAMPFADLLADVGQRQVRDLSVDELVRFVASNLETDVEARVGEV
jgi:acyl carrier protein